MSLLKPISDDSKPVGWVVHCPGCNRKHVLYTHSEQHPNWHFNKNMIAPTFSPSLLVKYGQGVVCHSFIRDGQWQFLNDCTHELAGKTVPMVEVD